MKRINKILNNLNLSSETNKIFQNISWLLIDKLFRYAIGLFIGFWFIRYLGPDRYGIYSYALAFTFLFSSITGLGLKGVVMRELVSHPKDRNKILGSCFIMMTIAGLMNWLIVSAAIHLIRPDDKLTFYLVFIIGASFVFHSFRTIAYYFDAQVKSKFAVWATNISYTISNLLKVIFIVTEQDLIAFAFVGFIDVLLTGISLFVMFRIKKQNIFIWKWNSKIARSLLKDSYPLILSALMIAIYMRIDQIMLREMTTNKEVGLYSAAVRLTELWYAIPLIVHHSVLPKVSRFVKDNDIERTFKIMSDIFKLTFLYAIAIIFLTIFFGKFVISVALGDEYLGAYSILFILIFSLLFTTMGLIRGVYLIANNYTKESFYCNLLGVIINIILNIVLIPNYGAIGSAVATLISYSISGYFSSFLIKKLRPIGFLMTKSILTTPQYLLSFYGRTKRN